MRLRPPDWANAASARSSAIAPSSGAQSRDLDMRVPRALEPLREAVGHRNRLGLRRALGTRHRVQRADASRRDAEDEPGVLDFDHDDALALADRGSAADLDHAVGLAGRDAEPARE